MYANDRDRQFSDHLQTLIGSSGTASGTTSEEVALGRDQGRIAFFTGVIAVIGGAALMPFTNIATNASTLGA